MKKVLSLLTLLLAVCSGAWASEVSDLTPITSATTIVANTLNGTSALVDKTLYASNTLLSVGGSGYSDKKGATTYNETEYTNVYQIKNSRQIALKIGFNATITVVGNSDSSRSWRIGTSSADNDIADGGNNSTTATGKVDGSSTTKTVYINASGDLYLGAIIITENTSKDPEISANATASIKAKTSGVEVTEDIAVSGANLTGSTLTATLSPAVTGLSVTLDATEITAGAISTTATLHYTATANASGSTTLTLSDGTTSKNITVNYTSKVVATELVAVSSAVTTTFDLSTVGTSGLDAVTADDGYVVLTDAGATVSFSENLAVAGLGSVNVTWRADAVQAPFFKFKTTVPGTVTVKFSDVGSSGTRANRYANVNGTRSDVYSTTSASGGVVTCSPIAVEAGDVVIKGQVAADGDTYSDNQIRVFTITFVPSLLAQTQTGRNYATCVTPGGKTLDFGAAEGITAYIATAMDKDNKTVTLKQVDIVPENTPIIYKTDAKGGQAYVPQTDAAADDVSENMLVAGDGTSWDGTSGYTYFYLASDLLHKATSGTLQFGKAYMKVADADVPADARDFSFVFGDESQTTGINAVENAKTINGFFNLNGQRVSQPTRGLYIVNGKKVIIK